jgi:hypothetical protein
MNSILLWSLSLRGRANKWGVLPVMAAYPLSQSEQTGTGSDFHNQNRNQTYFLKNWSWNCSWFYLCRELEPKHMSSYKINTLPLVVIWVSKSQTKSGWVWYSELESELFCEKLDVETNSEFDLYVWNQNWDSCNLILKTGTGGSLSK